MLYRIVVKEQIPESEYISYFGEGKQGHTYMCTDRGVIQIISLVDEFQVDELDLSRKYTKNA